MTRGRKRKRKPAVIVGVVLGVAVVLALAILFVTRYVKKNEVTAQDTLKTYFALVTEGKYEKMYSYLTESAQSQISKEDFVTRNQNIYEGIGCSKLQIEISEEDSEVSGNKATLVYSTTMQTLGGETKFENTANLIKDGKKGFLLDWKSNLIFPDLSEDCKVRVVSSPNKRGTIYDRNGYVLAEDGEVSEVGIVPGKLPENKEETIEKIASILDMTVESINNALSESWVKEDSYVPLKKMAKNDTEKENALLQCKGVLIQTVAGRVYPYGAAAGHLTGYVQSINEDQLKELEAEGYNSDSLIGKAGVEKAYEDVLRAKDGYSIYIEDEDGDLVGNIVSNDGEDGKNITLSIDITLQQNLYQAFKDDCGADVAMDPKTGEVLALVSTPGYDPNEFIWGMSDARWGELNDENGKQPLTNRFLASWVPGSTFKPIVAMIGITKGKLDPNENFGYEAGLSWQKDESWGGYHVTTLTDYGSEVNMKNALIFSDNIYFAKAALKIGSEDLINGFRDIGFSEEVPFELSLTTSTFGTDDKIDDEIQLADTGYGQGQVLVNPVHLASIYTALSNNGTMLKPTLVPTQGEGEIYKEGVFSKEAVSQVKDAMVQVLENPKGTGHAAYLEGHKLFGKTGTAETKRSQDDTGATEFGWLVCQTDESEEKQLEIVSMVQDIQSKEHGYINARIREIFAEYLK